MAKPKKTRVNKRKSPVQERSRATVDTILAATARVLVSDGYNGCTTNRVAEVAGVSVGSLYQYFPSKDALVAELVERHVNEIRDLVSAEVERARNLPMAEAVRAVVQLFAAAHEVNPKLHRIILEEIPRTGKLDKLDGVLQMIHAQVVSVFMERRHEVKVPDFELAAFMTVVAVDAIIKTALVYVPHRLADGSLVTEASALVLRYLSGGVSTEAPAAKASKRPRRQPQISI